MGTAGKIIWLLMFAREARETGLSQSMVDEKYVFKVTTRLHETGHSTLNLSLSANWMTTFQSKTVDLSDSQ